MASPAPCPSPSSVRPFGTGVPGRRRPGTPGLGCPGAPEIGAGVRMTPRRRPRTRIREGIRPRVRRAGCASPAQFVRSWHSLCRSGAAAQGVCFAACQGADCSPMKSSSMHRTVHAWMVRCPRCPVAVCLRKVRGLRGETAYYPHSPHPLPDTPATPDIPRRGGPIGPRRRLASYHLAA